MTRSDDIWGRRIRRIFVGFLVLVVLSAAILATPARSSRDAIHELTSRWVPVRTAERQLLTSFVEQESSERACVTTGDAKFLKPYQAGLEQVRNAFSTLARVFPSAPRGLALTHATRRRYHGWLTHSTQPEISVTRSGNGETIRSLIASGTGTVRFDQLRAALNAVTDFADRHSSVAERSIADANDRFFIILLIVLTIIALLAVIARRWLGQWTGRLDRQGQRLASIATMTEAAGSEATVVEVA